MKYHLQKFKHKDGNNIHGDCWRTAIACILDLERDEVPHVYESELYKTGKASAEALMGKWLLDRGYTLVEIPYACNVDELLDSTVMVMSPYLISAQSPRYDTNHVVIAQGGVIIHDPAGDVEPITEAGPDNHTWLGLIMPFNYGSFKFQGINNE